MDLIHTLTRGLDHNRWTVVGVLVLACSLILGSCGSFDGKVVSTTSGELLDQDGLKAEYVVESKSLQARYDAANAKRLEAEAEMSTVERQAEQLNTNLDSDTQRASDEVVARNDLIGQAAQLVTASTGVSWLLPLVSIGTSGLAAGTYLDNRRKDKVIKNKSDSEPAAS